MLNKNVGKAQTARKLQSSSVQQSDTLMYSVNTQQSTLLIPAYAEAIPVFAELDNPEFEWSALADVNGIENPLAHLVVPALDPDYWKIFEPWKDWDGPIGEEPRYEDIVYPKLEVEWDQDEPFNNYCPNNYPAGCVAIAIAQAFTITRNWEYIDNMHINYDNLIKIKDEFHAKYIYPQTADTLARVIRFIGNATDMEYKAGGSKTNTADAVETMFSHNMVVSDNYDKIRYALHQERGIVIVSSRTRTHFLGIFPRGTGHAYIIDGYTLYYNGDSYVHINYGWGPGYNGYFMKHIFNPEFVHNAEHKYPYEMQIFSIYPKKSN